MTQIDINSTTERDNLNAQIRKRLEEAGIPCETKTTYSEADIFLTPLSKGDRNQAWARIKPHYSSYGYNSTQKGFEVIVEPYSPGLYFSGREWRQVFRVRQDGTYNVKAIADRLIAIRDQLDAALRREQERHQEKQQVEGLIAADFPEGTCGVKVERNPDGTYIIQQVSASPLTVAEVQAIVEVFKAAKARRQEATQC